jgi:hypothetical protein
MDVKLKLSNSEHKDLTDFCNLNDLLISEVVKKSFTTGFHIEKYGLLNSDGVEVKEVIKEVIVEKQVEVPVEIIKEVEKEVIREIPVEKIVEKEVIKEIVKEIPVEKVVIQEVIKEVPVEKIVYVTDQQEMNDKIFQKDLEFEEQRRKFSTIKQDLENNFQDEKKELLLKIQQLENRPVETVEVVREVPVEVVVEKIVTKEVVDSSKNQLLQETLQKLRSENMEKDKKIKDLEARINAMGQEDVRRGAVYLRGSNLNDTLYK